jgi:hypothetical protein
VAIGITGLKMETTQNLVVSFRAQKNLDVVITNDLNFKKVNVTATADLLCLMCILESLAQMSLFLQIMVRLLLIRETGTYKIRVVSKVPAIQTTENHKIL